MYQAIRTALYLVVVPKFNDKKIKMSLRNKVTLIGHTGKKVELITFEKGKIAKVTLATNDYYTNAAVEKVEETQWHQLVASGKLTYVMGKYLSKGKEIAIEGKLVYRSFENKEGVKKYLTEIKVEKLLLLGSK